MITKNISLYKPISLFFQDFIFIALSVYSLFATHKWLQAEKELHKNRVEVYEILTAYSSYMDYFQKEYEKILNSASYIYTHSDRDYDEAYVLAYIFHYASQKYDIPVEVLLKLSFKESSFRSTAKTPYAVGIMQVNPHVWGFSETELYDPIKNILTGTFILKHYLTKTDGDLKKALELYSGGTTADHYYAYILSALYEKTDTANLKN